MRNGREGKLDTCKAASPLLVQAAAPCTAPRATEGTGLGEATSTSCSDFLRAVNLHRRQLARFQSQRDCEEGTLLKLEAAQHSSENRPHPTKLPAPIRTSSVTGRSQDHGSLPLFLQPGPHGMIMSIQSNAD